MSEKPCTDASNPPLLSVAPACSTAPPLLAIGAVYEWRGITVYMRACKPGLYDQHECAIEYPLAGGTKCERVDGCELKGPLNVPCPLCGELRPVTHIAGGIDLAEHIDRCRHVLGL